MKENEAIEEIKKKICGERPTQHICSDGCMKGNDMKYCPNCGQKLDWSDEQ